MGKAFCLRGGQEQRNLKRSQLVRSVDPDCYTYCEFGSKNHSGENPRDSNKIVPIYANPSAHPRCLVYLLDLYFSKFPDSSKLKAKDDIFYLGPISKNPINPVDQWYECAPVGRDKLAKYLETIYV